MKAIVEMSDKIKLEVEEKTIMETLHYAIILSNPRNYCNVCGSDSGFHFTTNKDKEGNTYINNKCDKCEARSKLGQYRAGGLFWREFEQYKPSANPAEGEKEPEAKTKEVKKAGENDIPF
jgi:hypothetical protein